MAVHVDALHAVGAVGRAEVVPDAGERHVAVPLAVRGVVLEGVVVVAPVAALHHRAVVALKALARRPGKIRLFRRGRLDVTGVDPRLDGPRGVARHARVRQHRVRHDARRAGEGKRGPPRHVGGVDGTGLVRTGHEHPADDAHIRDCAGRRAVHDVRHARRVEVDEQFARRLQRRRRADAPQRAARPRDAHDAALPPAVHPLHCPPPFPGFRPNLKIKSTSPTSWGRHTSSHSATSPPWKTRTMRWSVTVPPCSFRFQARARSWSAA